jgi:hypothetical protein
VPLIRYFVFVGGVLFALLFVADWYWQNPPPMSSYGSPIDETILRIRSEHKWPRKVELDTTTPIIVSPSPRTEDIAEAPIPSLPRPALNALAQANPPQREIAKRKATARFKYKNPDSDGQLRFAVNPSPAAWPAGW